MQAPEPNSPNEAFRDSIRLWGLNRRPNDSNVLRLEHLIEAGRELAVVIANQKTNRLRSVAERPRDLPRLMISGTPITSIRSSSASVHREPKCVQPEIRLRGIRSGNRSADETVEHLLGVEIGSDDLPGGVD
jgi:hypothetical protein